MKLSAPIHVLRAQAKRLKTEQNLSLAAAQNTIARREGYASWSQLIARQTKLKPESISELKTYLNNGDLILLGARPRLGKVRLAARLIAEAARTGAQSSYFFTLAERRVTIRSKIDTLLNDTEQTNNKIEIDCSDNICADFIVQQLNAQNIQGALVVVDYLQALDEKRSNPPLQEQLETLKAFAKTSGNTILLISQLDRSVDDTPARPPAEADVRLPNPLDLRLFNKIMFLYQGAESLRLKLRRPIDHEFTVTQEELGLT